MYLRNLEEKDAPMMLEWMHDASVVQYMQTDFASMTLENCVTFIHSSRISSKNLHFAIADDNDTYVGTVSLKNIDKQSKSAEFAITIRKSVMGQGYSQYAMQEMIRIGETELDLQYIYWYVSMLNQRAIRFYDKNQYSRMEQMPKVARKYYNKESLNNVIWYVSKRTI